MQIYNTIGNSEIRSQKRRCRLNLSYSYQMDIIKNEISKEKEIIKSSLSFLFLHVILVTTA